MFYPDPQIRYNDYFVIMTKFVIMTNIVLYEFLITIQCRLFIFYKMPEGFKNGLFKNIYNVVFSNKGEK